MASVTQVLVEATSGCAIAPVRTAGRDAAICSTPSRLAACDSEESAMLTGSVVDFDRTIIGCRFKKPGE